MACKPQYKGKRYNSLEELYRANGVNPQQKQHAQQLYSQYLEQGGSQGDIQGFKDFIQGKQFQKLTAEEKVRTIEQITKEHRSITALKDLSAKLANRIGGTVEFVNRTDVDWKAYNQGMKSVLNEAYMTPDTPFHEILAHPIIRAIKNNQETQHNLYRTNDDRFVLIKKDKSKIFFNTEREAKDYIKNNNNSTLYQNLLKELETGRGKEVFEQVKRDYKYKKNKFTPNNFDDIILEPYDIDLSDNKFDTHGYFIINNDEYQLKHVETSVGWDIIPFKNNIQISEEEYFNSYITEFSTRYDKKYTLEEQQEEAIVTLLGMMAADKLDAKKDATLISKLKELWKQISDFVRQLLLQDEIRIDKLPITTTLNDLAEIMGYGNNKIILPGYKVEYSTPLGNKYDTLEEVNQEIRGLADANVEVDLSGVKPNETIYNNSRIFKEDNKYFIEKIVFVNKYKKLWNGYINNNMLPNLKHIKSNTWEGIKKEAEEYINSPDNTDYSHIEYVIEPYESSNFKKLNIEDFIQKNKEYEQAREIIEQWKKENNIQYDPEEVYSRGQGFYSSIGAYSNLELDLLLKNLIQHIQDNKKAGGEFTISAFTKPIDKRLKHIEGTGDRVRFVIYPKSEHIKWAAPTDVYSGSVWDAHEKVSKDKKSELLGVSFTKAPALRNINEVSPNLADIVDNLSHAHNELGIELTTNNFRIEYDDNIDYSTKKLIDNINKILDDKYGKLEKPEIKKEVIESEDVYELRWKNGNVIGRYNSLEAAKKAQDGEYTDSDGNKISAEEATEIVKGQPIEKIGKQPTQTHKSLKKNINDIKREISPIINTIYRDTDMYRNYIEKYKPNEIFKKNGSYFLIKEHNLYYSKEKKDLELIIKEKEYTQQAEINLKVAALKEVARKYPRSLITSKVVPINPNMVDNSEIQYSKVGPKQDIEGFKNYVNNKFIFDKKLAQKIQKKLQELYPEIKVNITNNPIWAKSDNIFNQTEFDNRVNYRLKATEILLSDKAKQAFEKGKKNNWDLNKILTELQIPKEQRALLLDLGIKDREQLALELASKYGYTVEINTATKFDIEPGQEPHVDYNLIEDEDGNIIAAEPYSNTPIVNTKIYSYLSARNNENVSKYKAEDGWEYQELEFKIPLITPSIKGHAQFATEHGIGWARVWYNKKTGVVEIQEIQSDLFQKGRYKDDLAGGTNDKKDEFGDEYQTYYIGNVRYVGDIYEQRYQKFEPGYSGQLISKEEFEKNIPRKKDTNENQFLQLLNKDSNWVTFFIKSIIQDSAKKGYKKVLFPKGETAAKIEGHDTLEEFKKQKEDRIKELEEAKLKPPLYNQGQLISGKELSNKEGVIRVREISYLEKAFPKNQVDTVLGTNEYGYTHWYKDGEFYYAQLIKHEYYKIPKKYVEAAIEKANKENIKERNQEYDNEINTLKQELERVEIEGFSALSPIYNFYENIVANILKKQGYSSELFTDEYGNTWNEISLNQARDLQDILLQKNEANKIIGQANIKAMTVLVDAINQKQDTLPHEYAHHYIAWFRNTPIVQEGIKRFGSEEALVQAIGEQAVKQKGEAYNWWKKFTHWVLQLFSNEEILQFLTDSFLTRADLTRPLNQTFENQIKNISIFADNTEYSDEYIKMCK